MKKSLLLMLVASSSVQAATYNVSTTSEFRTALSNSANNGENNTILLANGTYKTTNDNEGTFIYQNNEAYSLTIKGSSAAKVILSGEKQTGIISFMSTEPADQIVTLENISFVNGANNDKGAGIYSALNLVVKGSLFRGNSSEIGAAIYGKSLRIENSQFIENSLRGTEVNNLNFGSAIYSADVFIDNTQFESNTGGTLLFAAALDNAKVTIMNSRFTNNIGDILWTSFSVDINNSVFANTIISDFPIGKISAGNAFGSQSSSIKNSIFVNTGLISLNSKHTFIESSLFNNSNLEFQYINNNIYNSIFLGSNIKAHPDPKEDYVILNIKNTYIDVNNLTNISYIIAESLIFDDVNLGFVDQIAGNYALTANSDLVNAGNSGIEGIIIPSQDLNGNERISDGKIDIGPYEYSSTRPVISSVSFTGVAKELHELNFTTDYTLSNGRNVNEITYDFLNNGEYTSTNSYTFNNAGPYILKVKVSDSEGEFATISHTVMIAELPYSEMTYSQKLVKAVVPELYDALLADIAFEKSLAIESAKQYVQDNVAEFNLVTVATKDAAVDAATLTGIANGKQYVQDNLVEFSLVTLAAKNTAVASATSAGIVTGKQYVQDNLVEFSLVTLAAKDTAVAEATSAGVISGKQYVQANLAEFSLVTLAAKNAAVASATSTGIVTGKQYVQENLAEFSLVTLAAKDTAVAEATSAGVISGKQYVQANLAEFSLVTLAVKNTAVASATSTGIVTGKQYVQDNLAEFSLVTVADRDTAVAEAVAAGVISGRQYVQANLTEFNLVTNLAKDTAVAEATSTGIETGKQYVQANLNEFSLVTVATKESAEATANSAGLATGKQLVIEDPTSYGIDIATEITSATIELLPEGWKMMSVPLTIEDMSIFDSAKIVWHFNDESQKWLAYSSSVSVVEELQAQGIEILSSVQADSGIWIEK